MGTNIVEEPAASSFRVEEFTPKIQAAGYSEILVYIVQTTWHHIPEGILSVFSVRISNLTCDYCVPMSRHNNAMHVVFMKMID
jgi:hypothetical protein